MNPQSPPSLLNPQTASIEEMKALVQATGLSHIAIIMDGNRRWAKQHHLPSLAGHAKGVDTLKTLVRYAGEIHLKVLTVYAFSTENWRRGEEEVGYLMKLFVQSLSKELESLHHHNVKLRFIGDLSLFPPDLQEILNRAMTLTQQNTGLLLQVATNYGSRAELTHALQVLAQQVKAGTLQPEEISEELISNTLYTAGVSDPELLIRTGGESRLSNYLLWQCAYTEICITPVFWPEFSPTALNQALLDYSQRERRFGQ